MPQPTFKYVWVVSGASIDGVEIFSKREALEQKLSQNGAEGLRKVEVGTNCWEYEVRGKKFRAAKQKVLDSHGLAVA